MNPSFHQVQCRIAFLQEQLDSLDHYLPETYQYLMEEMEAYLLRAQGQDDAKRRAHRCISAVQEALRLIDERRILG
jgi:uncharacterized protein